MWETGFIRSFHLRGAATDGGSPGLDLRVQPERQILHGVEGGAAACASARYAPSKQPKLGRGTDIALLA